MAKQSNNKQTKQKTNSKSLEKKAENVTELGTRLASTPFQFMKRFGEEMDRLFEDFGFGRGWLTPAIERGIGADVERGASQRVQRGERRIHVDGRRAVEREINLLFVLVLPEEAASARRRHRRDERQRGENPHDGQ